MPEHWYETNSECGNKYMVSISRDNNYGSKYTMYNLLIANSNDATEYIQCGYIFTSIEKASEAVSEFLRLGVI